MQNSKFKIIITIFIVTISMGIAYSTNYYCNPTTGNIDNDGSIDNPWSALSDVFSANKTLNSGDTLFLYNGNHGNVRVTGNNNDFIVITAITGQEPKLSSLVVNRGTFWKFNGLDIAKTAPKINYNVYDVSDHYFLVQTDKKSNNLYFNKCNIYTDSVDVANWERLDWFTGTLSGMMLRSKYTVVDNCTITNTNFSIEVHGRYTEFTNSIIENFVGDAIRALSSFSIYEYNTVKNSYDITGYDDNSSGKYPDYPIGKGNHDDLFQSYTSRVGGTEYAVTDNTVRYNKFYSYTDASQVDKSYTQGIALFDGFFNNWIIENNLIVTDSWHGITMLGVNDAVIANNTIINNSIYNDLVLGNGAAVNNMTPFIWVGKTKSGEKSYDNTIRNNLIIQSKFGASGYKNIIDEAENTLIQNNNTIPTATEANYFVDFNNFDINTKTNSPAIDQGINIDLQVYDINNFSRLIGTNVDCGAYEFDNLSEGNNCPRIDPIDNQSVKQYTTLELIIIAVDPDNSPITIESSQLEDFMEFTDNGDGTATLILSPLNGDLGKYEFTVTVSDDAANINSRSFTIEVEYGTTGLSDFKSNKIEVYPNPVQKGNLLYITVPDINSSNSGNVSIYTISGIKVLSINPSVQGNTLQIQTSAINKTGMYILKYNGYNKIINIQ